MLGLNVLSLFDGMSCGQIALERAGIKVNTYFASELDKYAIKVTQANYPKTVQLGCVTEWQSWDLPKIDLLIGGSPCQGFSFAGKQLNFDDPRSKLFLDYVDILNHYKPKCFLLENVKMKKEYQDIISKMLGVEPIEINSALVSAQNRKRLYWTDVPRVEQPEDKGVLLKDIIESGCIDESHTLSKKTMARLGRRKYSKPRANPEKTGTLNTKNNSGQLCLDSGTTLIQVEFADREPETLCGAMRGRYLIGGKRQDRKMLTAGKTKQYIELRHDEKTNSLTTVQKDNNIINTNSSKVRHELSELKYRKLTPLECERLQTVPDNYTSHVSNTQRYKMIGDGWTVDVIAHIFKGLK